MYAHPVLTAAIADERRRDLIAQADAYRRARTARPGRSQLVRSARPLSWRAVVATAAVLAFTVLLLLAPALSGHSLAGSWSGSWSSAVAGGTYHAPTRGVIHRAATNAGVHHASRGNWQSSYGQWG